MTACTSSGSTPGSASSTPSGPATDSAQDAGPIVPADSTLQWHSCAGLLAEMGIHDCTMLSVPLNYADPGGRHISLALDMIPATAPADQQQGVMLVNPGGPGASGLSLAAVVAEGLNRSVARDYDIVGFDMRGAGSSVPRLSCEPGFFAGLRPNYIPASAAAEQVMITRAKTYAADCEQKFGWLLPYMTTENAARDLDSIRAAFGVAQINYLGFSWGTYLGQVYATLFRIAPAAHGPGQHRRSHRDLVHRQRRPGLRLPGPHGRVLRLGGPATTASTSSAAPPPRCGPPITGPATSCWPTRSTG